MIGHAGNLHHKDSPPFGLCQNHGNSGLIGMARERLRQLFLHERLRNNFPISITIEYSTTGQAGGYLTDSAPESTHQPVQPLGGSYCDLVALGPRKNNFALSGRFFWPRASLFVPYRPAGGVGASLTPRRRPKLPRRKI